MHFRLLREILFLLPRCGRCRCRGYSVIPTGSTRFAHYKKLCQPCYNYLDAEDLAQLNTWFCTEVANFTKEIRLAQWRIENGLPQRETHYRPSPMP